jgi:hypothetical protein
MKNTAKLLIIALFLIWGVKSFAQPIFGVRAGLNMSNMLEKDDQETYSKDFNMRLGFHVGPTAEFKINDMFAFETGLLLSTKGYNFDESGTEEIMGISATYTSKGHVSLLYLDIPLTAKAVFDMNGTKLYGVFGPYIGLGLSGKHKNESTVTVAGVSTTENTDGDVSFGSGDNDIKPLDLGLQIGAGVELEKIQIGLAYNLGMANLAQSSDGGYKMNNRVLALSFGYKFGGK